MLNYVITYCKNTDTFIKELELLAPQYIVVEDGKKSWIIQTTPIVKNANGSLAMSILTDEELLFIGSMSTIQSLGTYEELFANPEALTLYKSVYPYDVPLNSIDTDGNQIEYYRPDRIGEFAV